MADEALGVFFSKNDILRYSPVQIIFDGISDQALSDPSFLDYTYLLNEWIIILIIIIEQYFFFCFFTPVRYDDRNDNKHLLRYTSASCTDSFEHIRARIALVLCAYYDTLTIWFRELRAKSCSFKSSYRFIVVLLLF